MLQIRKYYQFKCPCGYLFRISSLQAKTIKQANFLANDEHFEEHGFRHKLDSYEYLGKK